MSTCAVCNSPMKVIPAGVSKTTGRPYNAFEACPNKCPKPRPAVNPAYQSYQTAPTNAYGANLATSMQQEKKPDWDAISFGKCKHAYLVESFKYFINKGELGTIDLKSVESRCEEWARASINIHSKKDELKATTVDEEFNIGELPPF